jgi:hypothetical protein
VACIGSGSVRMSGRRRCCGICCLATSVPRSSYNQFSCDWETWNRPLFRPREPSREGLARRVGLPVRRGSSTPTAARDPAKRSRSAASRTVRRKREQAPTLASTWPARTPRARSPLRLSSRRAGQGPGPRGYPEEAASAHLDHELQPARLAGTHQQQTRDDREAEAK